MALHERLTRLGVEVTARYVTTRCVNPSGWLPPEEEVYTGWLIMFERGSAANDVFVGGSPCPQSEEEGRRDVPCGHIQTTALVHSEHKVVVDRSFLDMCTQLGSTGNVGDLHDRYVDAYDDICAALDARYR